MDNLPTNLYFYCRQTLRLKNYNNIGGGGVNPELVGNWYNIQSGTAQAVPLCICLSIYSFLLTMYCVSFTKHQHHKNKSKTHESHQWNSHETKFKDVTSGTGRGSTAWKGTIAGIVYEIVIEGNNSTNNSQKHKVRANR